MKAKRRVGRSDGAIARAQRETDERAGARRETAIKEASRPTPSARAEVLYVWDTNAAPGATRVHDVIVKKDARGQILTKPYALSNEKPCEMPAGHALQFLRDASFVVSTIDVLEEREEHRIRPVKARSESVNIIALTENETIAEWSELSDDALVRRAHVIPAAEKPAEGATRGELIAFLTEASRVKKHDGDRLADEGELEGMGGEELDRVLGGDRRAGIDRDLPGSRTVVRPAPQPKKAS